MASPPASPAPHPSGLPIAVLGAGITGLTAALRIQAAGLSVVVFEATDRVGGAIQSLHTDGWLHEAGPNSLMEEGSIGPEVIAEAGLGERRLYAAPAAKRRYVVRGGRLVPMPATPGEFCTTGLFSGSAKLALVAEVLRRRGPADGSESVADFTVRRLGREFLDYAIDPFVAGVYAGDPARLSVREAFPKLHALEQQHGSLIRGALRKRNASAGPRVRMVSFPEGLAELPKALAVKLGPAVRLRTRVRAVARRGRDWVLTTERDGLARTETFAGVVCALPADALAEVRWDDFPEAQAFAALAGIDHPPVVSVFLGFRRADVAHPLDGFGFLVPKVERRSILGTLFSSTLFAGRSPDGCVALTTFVGGARQPDLAALDDGQLVRLVRAELGDLLGVRAGPIFVSLRRHPRAIPQYGIGHARHQAACAAAEAAAPGLSIGGNVRDGISLSSCLVSGCRLARAAIAG